MPVIVCKTISDTCAVASRPHLALTELRLDSQFAINVVRTFSLVKTSFTISGTPNLMCDTNTPTHLISASASDTSRWQREQQTYPIVDKPTSASQSHEGHEIFFLSTFCYFLSFLSSFWRWCKRLMKLPTVCWDCLEIGVNGNWWWCPMQPETDFSSSWLVQVEGNRLVVLEPSELCIRDCRQVSVLLKPNDVCKCLQGTAIGMLYSMCSKV